MVFVPQWILLSLCIMIAGFYKKWYSSPGYWLIIGMVFFFLVLPLSLQWAYDIWALQGLLDVYHIIEPATPKPIMIPLFNVSLNPFNVEANVEPLIISVVFIFLVVFTTTFIMRLNKAWQGVFVFVSAVMLFYGLLVGLSWFNWVVKLFSMGQLDISATLFNWSDFTLLYHIIFNFIPLAVIYIGLVKLYNKIGGWL